MPSSETLDQAILLAMRSLSGERQISEVREWIEARYPGRWRDVKTAMADLTFPGSRSSRHPAHARFLTRVSKGVYRLR
jgi:hypothetical protein